MLFRSDLDKATQAQLDRGVRLVEVLKQPQYQPMPVSEQIAIIYAGTRGHLDEVPVARVRAFEAAFLAFLREKKKALLETIAKEKDISPETDKALAGAIAEFKKGWKA